MDNNVLLRGKEIAELVLSNVYTISHLLVTESSEQKEPFVSKNEKVPWEFLLILRPH